MHARFPCSYENEGRARSGKSAPGERSRADWCLRNSARKFLFSRSRRLGGPQAFSKIFAFRCSVAGDQFQVYAMPHGTEPARLGVVASKRLMPAAVSRNYCKRLAREVFRTECAAVNGIDVVVRARKPVTVASAVQARAEICDLLRRVELKCRLRA